jgi:hypothetical protein
VVDIPPSLDDRYLTETCHPYVHQHPVVRRDWSVCRYYYPDHGMLKRKRPARVVLPPAGEGTGGR